jgi:hypothetical protein
MTVLFFLRDPMSFIGGIPWLTLATRRVVKGGICPIYKKIVSCGVRDKIKE